ncbi:NHL repeat-containing protein [Aegicerativicinus sediminis]|uniref:hypothetical protein n=1 Tax=Aegicerativicinus sediminis TaxID=2893202 RepID=UPI001E3B9F68|nr:hypothetical protein [Aegicerativicinus sediminis]
MSLKSLLYFFILSPLIWNCNTGNLDVIADLPNNLREVSAIQLIEGSPLYWVIEDAGNEPILYGLGEDGGIQQQLRITNAENEDWEDLAADSNGNLYIADIGNNSGKRDDFTIYKLKYPEKETTKAQAEAIHFSLPKKMDDKDMESLFIHDGNCYVVTKEHGSFSILKFPNTAGEHKAKVVSEANIKGKANRITSADISADGRTLALLTNDKLYLFSDYKGDDFLEGNEQQLEFKHHSQKEGLCFESANSFLITDEDTGFGGNIYRLQL